MAQFQEYQTESDPSWPRSPLQRDPEQPPCDSEAEAICLNGMLACPARVKHYDLGPHLVFVEHRAIWRSMARVPTDPDPDGFWWRVFVDLRKEHTAEEARQVLGVLNWIPFQSVDDSDGGALLFALALTKVRRCTEARREIHAAQERVIVAWRVPGTPYTPEERRRLFGSKRGKPADW